METQAKNMAHTSLSIYAWNVNTGGGAVLLDRLARTARERYSEVRVFADPRNPSPYLRKIGARYVSGRLEALTMGEAGARNIYFGNVPPLRRVPNSLLYVHSPYVVKTVGELLTSKLETRLKVRHMLLALLLKLFHRNVDRVCCQTASMQDALAHNHGISAELMPFYPPIEAVAPRQKVFDLCYVGLPSAHKNHEFLLDVMEVLGQEDRPTVRVAVTIPKTLANRQLLDRITVLNNHAPIEIVNHGLVPHPAALDIYRESRALLFPSRLETYGLPLIEATLLGLPVFCPSLPYSNDVLEDFVPVDLTDTAATATLIGHFLANPGDYPPPKLRMPDMIDRLLQT